MKKARRRLKRQNGSCWTLDEMEDKRRHQRKASNGNQRSKQLLKWKKEVAIEVSSYNGIPSKLEKRTKRVKVCHVDMSKAACRKSIHQILTALCVRQCLPRRGGGTDNWLHSKKGCDPANIKYPLSWLKGK